MFAQFKLFGWFGSTLNIEWFIGEEYEQAKDDYQFRVYSSTDLSKQGFNIHDNVYQLYGNY